MKFLVDASVSPQAAQTLNDAGHDSVHVAVALSLDAADENIFDHAGREARVVVAATPTSPTCWPTGRWPSHR